MKNVLVIDGEEIQQAVLAMVLRRPSMAGRHVGAVHLICNPDEPRANLRIRAALVHFDTEAKARAYGQAPEAEKKGDEAVTENLAAPGAA